MARKPFRVIVFGPLAATALAGVLLAAPALGQQASKSAGPTATPPMSVEQTGGSIIVRNVQATAQGPDLLRAKERAISILFAKGKTRSGVTGIEPWYEVRRERFGGDTYEIVADVGFNMKPTAARLNDPLASAGLVRMGDDPRQARQGGLSGKEWGVMGTAVRAPDGSLKLWNTAQKSDDWLAIREGAMKPVGGILVAPPDPDKELADAFAMEDLGHIQAHYQGAFASLAIWDPANRTLTVKTMKKDGTASESQEEVQDRSALKATAFRMVHDLMVGKPRVAEVARIEAVQRISPTMVALQLPPGNDSLFGKLRLASFSSPGIGVRRDETHALIEGDSTEALESFISKIGLRPEQPLSTTR